ncbi:MAG: hypothetical protein V4547_08965 [Bacteroidota bacterium]
MPTGYTAGILDGKITTFPQFAKQCMRAFGATIHMRDENSDVEYIKREPSDYHTKGISKAKKSLNDAKALIDKSIVAARKSELKKSRKYHIESIEKAKSNTKKMNAILKEVNDWQPPTPEHYELKVFMIDQIVKTIDFDCGTKYHDEYLLKIESELIGINAKTIREESIVQANKDLEYHTKEYEKDLKRCEYSNKWVTDLLNSIN